MSSFALTLVKLLYRLILMITINMNKLNDIKYCPYCKICRDIQCFRSLNKNKDYNKLCRRCLNSTKGYEQQLCLHTVFKRVFHQTLKVLI